MLICSGQKRRCKVISQVASLALQGFVLLLSTGVTSWDGTSCIPLLEPEPSRHCSCPHLSLSQRSALLRSTPARGCSPSSLEELGKDQASTASESPCTGNTNRSGERVSWLSHLQMSAPVLVSIFSHLFYCLLSEVGKTMSIYNPVSA